MGRSDKERDTIFRSMALSMAPAEHRAADSRPDDEGRLERRLAPAIFSSTPESMAIAGPDGRIVAANPAFSRLTGYTIDDVRGCDFGILLGETDPELREDIWNAVQTRGYWRGEIWGRRKNAEVYPALLTIHAVRDDAGITHYVATSTDLTGVDWSTPQSQYLLRHDGLTGLPNRVFLYSRLDQTIARAAESGSRAAVLIIGLDRFETVDDGLGHEGGAEVLTSAGKRLRRRLRDSDLLARLEGDEFAVVLENADAEAATALAEKLIGALAERFVLPMGRDIYIGASVGAAVFPDHGSSAHELVQRAEAALHRAETAGTGVYRLYSADLTRAADRRLTLDAKMRRALEQNEFELHYQPICALADRKILCVEALLRWNDRTAGPLAPGDFIPLAEQTGVIVPLSDWVLRAACAQMTTWRAEGLPFRRMAVNVPAAFFRSGDVLERLSRILAETGLPGECLELELTEGALLENTADLRDRLSAVKALGVGLAIDDFGTGYSSLAYLGRLPIDTLKIDRAFIADIPDDSTAAKITSAIITLARDLDLHVVAEGVETERQREFLLDRGLVFGQGNLFGPPAAAESLADLLARRRRENPPREIGKSPVPRRALQARALRSQTKDVRRPEL